MLTAAIVSLGSKSSEWTAESLKKYFDVVDMLDIRKLSVTLGGKGHEIIYDGETLHKKYDCIYAKGSFRYVNLLRALTSVVSKESYTPMNANAFTIGHDKILTHLALQKANIPMPKTYIAATVDVAKEILQLVNYPIIMKFPSGTHGKGVMFADSYESAASVLDALSVLNQPFLIQEYVETGGVDTRAIVVGDQVVASMKRMSVQGDMRANIHAGGKGEACTIDAHTKKIAIDSAKAIGAEICAVDILEGAKGPVVIEVNLSPGLQGITSVTKVDMADKIAQYLHKQSKELADSGKTSGTEEIMADLGISKAAEAQQIITSVDFRGNRILMPEVITKITQFKPRQELVIRAKEGKLEVEEFKID